MFIIKVLLVSDLVNLSFTFYGMGPTLRQFSQL